MNIRTDLAVESRELIKEDEVFSVKEKEQQSLNMKITEIVIDNDDDSVKLSKDKGTYITFEFPNISEKVMYTDERIPVIAEHIRKLLPKEGTILVAGLGNNNITPDALGVRCANGIIATRHITEETAVQTGIEHLRSVSVITTGVLGQTGIETVEFIGSIVNKIKPSAVIVIDALASRKLNRLGCTLQISDTGIAPGSGVNNRRFAINQKALGIPVIAIGIPTVVDAVTLTCDIMSEYVCKEHIKEDICPNGRKMIVTPDNIDVIIQRGTELISLAVNSALYPCLTLSDIVALCG